MAALSEDKKKKLESVNEGEIWDNDPRYVFMTWCTNSHFESMYSSSLLCHKKNISQPTCARLMTAIRCQWYRIYCTSILDWSSCSAKTFVGLLNGVKQFRATSVLTISILPSCQPTKAWSYYQARQEWYSMACSYVHVWFCRKIWCKGSTTCHSSKLTAQVFSQYFVDCSKYEFPASC